MDELLAINPKDEEILKLKELDPAIIVPLRAKGSINGMLILGEKIDNEPFGERDKEHLLNIASFAAIAIHNAFLFEMTTTDMMTKLKLKHFFLNYLREKMEATQAGSFGNLHHHAGHRPIQKPQRYLWPP
jgi:two-component system cell cycle response regulator